MFAKVFEQIYDSSIADDFLVRLVFEDFLVLADRDGVVDMTPRAIAGRTNVPLEIVQRGIEKLSSPDPESRTPNHEGRRIMPLDQHRSWGWQIVNYQQYRDIRNEDGRKEYMRNYMRKRRKPDPNTEVNSVNFCKPPLAKADAEAEADNTAPQFSPEQTARAAREALRLAGREITTILDEICRAEMKDGKKAEPLRDELVAAWTAYQAAVTAGKVEFPSGHEKFFGSGMWRDQKLWRWKDGRQPKAKTETSIERHRREQAQG
jgi:hypothetical protein